MRQKKKEIDDIAQRILNNSIPNQFLTADLLTSIFLFLTVEEMVDARSVSKSFFLCAFFESYSQEDSRRLEYAWLVTLWADPKPQRNLITHSTSIHTCAISTNGYYIATGLNDGCVLLYNTKTKDLTKIGAHRQRINACIFSKNNRLLVTASNDATLKIWDIYNTKKELQTIACHNKPVSACAISADNQYIISASSDKTLKAWCAKTGELLFTIHDTISVFTCAMSPNNKYFASGSNTIKMWDFETRREMLTYENEDGMVFYSSAFSPDSRHLAVGSANGNLILWNIEALESITPMTLKSHRDAVRAVAFSHDGKFIVSGASDKTIKLWNADTGALIHTHAVEQEDIITCAFTPDDNAIIFADSTHALKILHIGDKSGLMHIASDDSTTTEIPSMVI